MCYLLNNKYTENVLLKIYTNYYITLYQPIYLELPKYTKYIFLNVLHLNFIQKYLNDNF